MLGFCVDASLITCFGTTVIMCISAMLSCQAPLTIQVLVMRVFMIVCDDLVLNTLPAELQLPVLNSKFTFLSFFQTNLDKIWNDDGAGEYLVLYCIAHTKLYQVWLVNSQEKWMHRLGQRLAV